MAGQSPNRPAQTVVPQNMSKKIVISQKKKRGPPATGQGAPINVRIHPAQLRTLDAWIAAQAQPFPSRPEAVRRLMELGLQAWVEDQRRG